MNKADAGKKGGTKTKELYGEEHFSKAGEIGGNKLLKERGKEFYRQIGLKGATARRKKMLERKLDK